MKNRTASELPGFYAEQVIVPAGNFKSVVSQTDGGGSALCALGACAWCGLEIANAFHQCGCPQYGYNRDWHCKSCVNSLVGASCLTCIACAVGCATGNIWFCRSFNKGNEP
jgi:hypothetical protein